LLKAETAEREVRSVAYQIKAARFPAYKDLSGFDFASSEINEARVYAVAGTRSNSLPSLWRRRAGRLS
jgi:DNA replication protein DnaC